VCVVIFSSFRYRYLHSVHKNEELGGLFEKENSFFDVRSSFERAVSKKKKKKKKWHPIKLFSPQM
jgi:hypothetical protein